MCECDRNSAAKLNFIACMVFVSLTSASDTSFLELARPFIMAVHRDSRVKSQMGKEPAGVVSFRAARIFWLGREQAGTTFSTKTLRYLSFSWSLSHSVCSCFKILSVLSFSCSVFCVRCSTSSVRSRSCWL